MEEAILGVIIASLAVVFSLSLLLNCFLYWLWCLENSKRFRTTADFHANDPEFIRLNRRDDLRELENKRLKDECRQLKDSIDELSRDRDSLRGAVDNISRAWQSLV